MSFEKIHQLVGSLVKTVEDSQKIATPVLAAKLAKCMEAYPEDQTIGAMARVIDKMADNNTIFIRKAELKSLYNKLYSRNTKFAQLFSEELGLTNQSDEPEVKAGASKADAVINPYENADPILANALNSVFDKNAPLKMYSQTLADKAKFAVGTTLDAWNLKPTSLTVDDGNEKFLVIKADYDTPKGITSFYVPVEIADNKVAEASVFMGNSGPQELNNTNIKYYLKSFAGSKLQVNAPIILSALDSATSNHREISAAEIALTKLNASRQTKSDFFHNQITGLKVAEEAPKDIEIAKSDEFKSFEEQFSSPYGQAAFQFGEDKVTLAREHIARELLGFGYKNPQITVTSTDNSTIFYGVSLDAGRVAFTVPVKLASGKLQKPGVLICNGSMLSFDKSGINTLYVNNQTDYKVAATASPQFGLKPSDLVNNVREAVSEGNTVKAEDALNVLSNTGDAKAYAIAFQIFMDGLSGKIAKASAESEHKCSLMMKSASSEHMVCGHTGLPVHKVYQDQYGNCRPMYRRSMDETYEGASFMNAKIFG
jgi:hypothetical protein